MNHLLPRKNSSFSQNTLTSGQMLIGVLVAIAVFLILSHALFTLISASANLVSANKARLTAKYTASEKIETIRNMDYEDIGVIGGIPAGLIEPQETINKNGLSMEVTTSVVYIDDPLDGSGSDDLFPDYKRVRVEVSWEGIATSVRSPLVLITDIANNSLSGSTTGGTLDIVVLDAYGLPVSEADVHIFADTISPVVDVNLETNDQGHVTLPGATACVECYLITISKDGYSQDRTYSTTEVTNPSKPYGSVIEGQVTQIGFAIDLASSINVSTLKSREENFDPQASVELRLRGNKTIGTDAFLQPVYKYDEVFTTDENGTTTIENLEWDNYTIFAPDITSYDIAGTNPLLPINLFPDQSVEIIITTNSHSDYSLLNIVKDSSLNSIEEAYVTLSFGAFEEEKTSGIEDDPDFGQAFFANINNDNYTITATASGYQNYSSNHEVEGNDQFTIIMNPQ